MKRRGRGAAVTLAALAAVGVGIALAVVVISASALGYPGHCQGLRVAGPRRSGWWSYPGKRFSRAWLCGHFGRPRTVAHTRAGIVWSYGLAGRRGLVFLREPDGRFTMSAPPRASDIESPPRDAWWLGGRGCPIARRSPDLPRRSGCVIFGKFDVNGDGHPDRILLYAHLSHRRAGEGFIPISFTLKVLLTGGGGTYTAQIDHPRANVTIDSGGNLNGRPGAELFLNESRYQGHTFLLAHQRQLALVYAFNGHRLTRAGSFWWDGDQTHKYGITCHEHSPTAIIQHEFVRNGRQWLRIDTTYSWFGATLRRIVTRSEQRQAPYQKLTTVDCRFA